MTPARGACCCDVCGTDALSEGQLAYLIGQLPHWRREKTLALRFVHDRASSACAWALVRQTVLEQYGIDVNTLEPTLGPQGKPAFGLNLGLHFNLSHTRGAALGAVAGSPVGCDVQTYAEMPMYDEALERHVLHPHEQAVLAPLAHDRHRRALTLFWAVKEAYTKQLGAGFTIEVRTLDFSRGVRDYLATFPLPVSPNKMRDDIEDPWGTIATSPMPFLSHGLWFTLYERGSAVMCACAESPITYITTTREALLTGHL